MPEGPGRSVRPASPPALPGRAAVLEAADRWRAELPPEAYIVVASFSVQIGASLATELLRDRPAITVVTLRLVFGALLLLTLRRPSLALARPGAWRGAMVLGAIFVLMNTSFYTAISRIPLGVAVTLEFWGPLAIAVFGSRRLRDLVWVALAAGGIYLLAGGRLTAGDLLGVAAALAAGLFWMTFILLGPRFGEDWPDGRGLTVALVFGSLFAIPLAALGGGAGALGLDAGLLAGGFVIGAFSTALPWSLELAAMRRIPAPTYGVLMSLEPAIAALVGFVLLGQQPAAEDALAIGLVVVASAGASVSARMLRVTPGELEAA